MYHHNIQKRTTIYSHFYGIVTVFLLFILPISLSAQTGSITGSIKTSEGQPANHLRITLDEDENFITTDSNGYFIIKNIPQGLHKLRIFAGNTFMQQNEVNVDSENITNINLSINNLTHQQLDEIIVSGESTYVSTRPSSSLRLNVDLMEVPQNISVTTSQTIKDLGLRGASEILRTAAGAMPYNAAGQDLMVTLRGTTTFYGTLRNGIGSGYYFNQEPDAAMIDRVEFISGPAGFMISNTDPGGMVNFVTKQPARQRILNIDAGLGSWNMMRAAIDLGGELKKGSPVTFRINAGIHNQQRRYQFGYLTKYFAAAVIKYDLSEKTDFSFEYNYAHGKSLNNQQYLPTVNSKFFTVPDNINVADPNVGGLRTYDHYSRFNFNHRFNETWSLNAQMGSVLGAWRSNSMGIAIDAPVANDTIYRYLFKDDYTNKLYTANAFLKGDFYTGTKVQHAILAGIDMGSAKTNDIYDQTYDQRLGLNYNAPVYYLPKDSVTFAPIAPYLFETGNYYTAIYIQDHVKFYNKFVLTLAGRFTNCTSFGTVSTPSNQNDKRFTPRIGMTYLFNNNLSVYALRDEAFIPQIGKSFTKEQFSPLNGINYEIGLKSLWFNRTFSTNIALYQTIRNNVLTSDPEHPGFSIQTGQIVAKGIELNINGQLTRNLSIIANYTYSDNRVTKTNDTRKPVGYYNFASPVHNMANVFLKYRILKGALNGLSFGVGVQHIDKFNSSTTTNVFVKGYTIFEASAGYKIGKFYCNLNVYNLTNLQYVTYAFAYAKTEWAYTPGQPVNFRLNFGYQL